MALSIKLKTLRKNHKEHQVNALESYEIDGKVYVTTMFLETLFGISSRQFTNLKKKGLEETTFSIANMKLFDLNYAVSWHSLNVNRDKSKAGKKNSKKIPNQIPNSGRTEEGTGGTSEELGKEQGQGQFDFNGISIENLPIDEVDRKKKIEELITAQRKNAIEAGLYMPIEDNDISKAELAGMLISLLGNLRDIIPTEAEHQDRDRIIEILDFQFKDKIGELKEIVLKTTKENPDPTVYQVLMTIINLSNKGVSSIKMKETLEKMITEVQD